MKTRVVCRHCRQHIRLHESTDKWFHEDGFSLCRNARTEAAPKLERVA